MEQYIELYNELQDFKRQQPFGFTQFFGNLPTRVFDQNGVVTQQAPFLFLHERVRELLASLSAVQIQKYTANLSRTMDMFVRWLQARRPGWRGQASGKENEAPNTQGGALNWTSPYIANSQEGSIVTPQTRSVFNNLITQIQNLLHEFEQVNRPMYQNWIQRNYTFRPENIAMHAHPSHMDSEFGIQRGISLYRSAIVELQRLQASGWPSGTDNPQEGGRLGVRYRRSGYRLP